MATETRTGSRIQIPKVESTWLVLGGVALFVLVIAFFVLQLPRPTGGYGGLSTRIILTSLSQMVPSLLGIVALSALLEVAIYVTIEKQPSRFYLYPIFMVVSVLAVLYLVAGRDVALWRIPGTIIQAAFGEQSRTVLIMLIGEAVLFGVFSLVPRQFSLPYALLSPAVVGLTVFVVYPFIYDVLLSASDAKLSTLPCYSVSPEMQARCELDVNGNGTLEWFPDKFNLDYLAKNFQRVFVTRNPETGKLEWGPLLYTPASTFPNLLGRTILWTVINVFFHVTIGMILALLLNRELALKGIYRTLLIIPWAIPQVIVALAWRGEFHSSFGFVNVLLDTMSKWGIPGLFTLGDICVQGTCFGPLPWLREQPWAMIAAIIVNVWLGIPFMMVIFLGGLQSIPREFYEASELDGASKWQSFWQITMPMMRPIVVPAVTLGAIWTFNQFNVIYLITEGGPQEKTDILVTALFTAAIGNSRYAFGAAFSIVIFVILLLYAIGWVQLSGGLKGVYE
ncbi:MAG: sugar ABC transporter permease [Anaerolineae bacterium]|nr:sugar ABC transporter permease [Anaerolineae bacterium]